MNTTSTPARHVSARAALAIGAGLALILTACGGDDGDDGGGAEPAATTAAPGTTVAVEIPTEPTSIAFDDQESDGSTITVSAVELPAPGFIAVHSDADGSPGPVIGVSDLLPTGSSVDVTVALDDPLTADATVFPMVHIDTNGNGVYEFGAVDGVDGPGVTAGGDVAVVGATVTVTGAASSGGGEDGEAHEITIADFAFGGVTEVFVGDTVVVTNTDGTNHTWTAEDGSFDSGALGQGDTFEFTFTEAGQFSYFCNFHPSMTGQIVVVG